MGKRPNTSFSGNLFICLFIYFHRGFEPFLTWPRPPTHRDSLWPSFPGFKAGPRWPSQAALTEGGLEKRPVCRSCFCVVWDFRNGKCKIPGQDVESLRYSPHSFATGSIVRLHLEPAEETRSGSWKSLCLFLRPGDSKPLSFVRENSTRVSEKVLYAFFFVQLNARFSLEARSERSARLITTQRLSCVFTLLPPTTLHHIHKFVNTAPTVDFS